MAREDMAMPEEAAPEQAMPEEAPAAGAPKASGGKLFGEPKKASPEEQKAYETFVAQAFNLIYDDKSLPKVLTMLKGEGQPMEGLARATVQIVARVAMSGEQAGQKFKAHIVHAAGREVLEDLAELSRVAKIHDYTKDKKSLEGAYFRAMDMFRKTAEQAGRIKPETFQRELAKLKAGDESGDLEAELIAMAERDRQGRPAKGKKKKSEEPVEEGAGLMAAAGGY